MTILEILLDIRVSKVNGFILNIPHGRQRQELLKFINLMKNLGNTHACTWTIHRQLTELLYIRFKKQFPRIVCSPFSNR